MRTLFNYEGIKVDCIYCEKIDIDYKGWDSLCNRTCYYGITDLLTKYNNGEVSEPDPKIIKYFTKHPDSSHSFFSEKILSYLKQRTD